MTPFTADAGLYMPPLQGSGFGARLSQGVDLGWYMPPLQGCTARLFSDGVGRRFSSAKPPHTTLRRIRFAPASHVSGASLSRLLRLMLAWSVSTILRSAL